MIAVDTSVWIDYFAGRSTRPALLLKRLVDESPSEIALVDLVFAEVLQGLRHDRDVRRVDSYLSEFHMLWLTGMPDFRAAAGLYRAARERGIPIRSTIDCLIAAVCIREDVSLLHADKEFDNLAGLAALSVVDFG